ncbi:hypothetical protein [Actinokineospora sp.]|uniref:hypothetical protein n=1 Tax=Actinokineospora sp. TaxID=1872133 RepID=UPI0040381F60
MSNSISTSNFDDAPTWTLRTDAELDEGYQLRPDQLPSLFALYRNPLWFAPHEDPGPIGAVAWGFQLPDGDTVTVLPAGPGGRSRTLFSAGTEGMVARWVDRLDAELLWLPAPSDLRLREERG